MWFDRGRSFGGLRRRYKKFRNGMVEALDPVTADIVAFATELQYDNWLLRRFDPAVRDLDSTPKPLAQWRNGKRVTSHPLLSFIAADGIHVVEWVVSKDRTEPQDLELVEPFGRSHRLSVSVRARDVIRGNPTLLANLDHVRQSLAMRVNVELSSERRAILHALQENNRIVLAELLSRAQSQKGTAHSSRVETAVLKLFAAGIVDMNLCEVPYGTETVISI